MSFFIFVFCSIENSKKIKKISGKKHTQKGGGSQSAKEGRRVFLRRRPRRTVVLDEIFDDAIRFGGVRLIW